MDDYGFDPSELDDGDRILLEIPDDDPVLADYDPNDTRSDRGHDFVYVTRWDADRGRVSMAWGHKPRSRPGMNASYTRIYSKVRKCKICGVEAKGASPVDCEEWRGECNSCGASIDPDAENYGKCDDCRGPLPTGSVELTEKVFYRDRLRRFKQAKGEL